MGEFVPIVLDKTPEFELDSGEVIEFPLGLFFIGIGFLILALMEHLDMRQIFQSVYRCLPCCPACAPCLKPKPEIRDSVDEVGIISDVKIQTIDDIRKKSFARVLKLTA